MRAILGRVDLGNLSIYIFWVQSRQTLCHLEPQYSMTLQHIPYAMYFVVGQSALCRCLSQQKRHSWRTFEHVANSIHLTLMPLRAMKPLKAALEKPFMKTVSTLTRHFCVLHFYHAGMERLKENCLLVYGRAKPELTTSLGPVGDCPLYQRFWLLYHHNETAHRRGSTSYDIMLPGIDHSRGG